jgi:hypothetical protein
MHSAYSPKTSAGGLLPSTYPSARLFVWHVNLHDDLMVNGHRILPLIICVREIAKVWRDC